MTMFASKTPRMLNRDPKPWRVTSGRFAGRYVSLSTIPSPQFAVVVEDPRPEFDHVQHNEPNPILVEFRYQRKHSRMGVDDLLDSFLDWLDDAMEGNPYCVANNLTNAHIDHARRVLTLLAKIGASE